MFESERLALQRTLAPWLAGPIEHVGSTAVPGLAAKPVIDIMAAVEGLDASRSAIRAAEAEGYVYWPHQASVMHWFCKPSEATEPITCTWFHMGAACGGRGSASAMHCVRTLGWHRNMLG